MVCVWGGGEILQKPKILFPLSHNFKDREIDSQHISEKRNVKFQLKEKYVFTYMIIVNIPGQIHTAISQTG